MSEYSVTENSRLRRHPQCGSYAKEVIRTLIDEAPYCHVSAQVDGSPYIQATVLWRESDNLYIHGSRGNRMISAISSGAKAALAFTHFDGYILTRAAISHVVSYRSVTLFAAASEIVDAGEKERLLGLFVDRISSGRWPTIRRPTSKELEQVGILKFVIGDVSAKLMMQGSEPLAVLPGGKYEPEGDSAFSPWTGLVPYRLERGKPVNSDELRARCI